MASSLATAIERTRTLVTSFNEARSRYEGRLRLLQIIRRTNDGFDPDIMTHTLCALASSRCIYDGRKLVKEEVSHLFLDDGRMIEVGSSSQKGVLLDHSIATVTFHRPIGHDTSHHGEGGVVDLNTLFVISHPVWGYRIYDAKTKERVDEVLGVVNTFASEFCRDQPPPDAAVAIEPRVLEALNEAKAKKAQGGTLRRFASMKSPREVKTSAVEIYAPPTACARPPKLLEPPGSAHADATDNKTREANERTDKMIGRVLAVRSSLEESAKKISGLMAAIASTSTDDIPTPTRAMKRRSVEYEKEAKEMETPFEDAEDKGAAIASGRKRARAWRRAGAQDKVAVQAETTARQDAHHSTAATELLKGKNSPPRLNPELKDLEEMQRQNKELKLMLAEREETLARHFARIKAKRMEQQEGLAELSTHIGTTMSRLSALEMETMDVT